MQQIQQPLMTELKQLELPINSIYHYVTYDGVDLGPPADDYLFRNLKKPLMVGHVLELGDIKGTPRKLGLNALEMVRDYHNFNRRSRMMRNLDSADRDATALIAYNYCILNKTYRYVHSIYTEYYRWNNVFASVIDTIVKATETSERQHYFMAASPKVIPSQQQLNMASKDMTQALLKVFRDKDAFLLLELWKWLSDERGSSIIDRIPINKIHLVNIVFQESGRWAIVNLGNLNAFRVGIKESDAVIKSKQILNTVQIQKRLLRMFMSVMEARTVTANSNAGDDLGNFEVELKLEDPGEDADLPENDDEEQAPTRVRNDPSLSMLPPAPVVVPPLSEEQQVLDEQDDEDADEEAAAERIRLEDELLDEELAQLNEIARRQVEDEIGQEATLKEVIFQDHGKSLVEGVTDVCNRLADDGLLTGGEYRRFGKLASTYKTIISPDGVTPLEKFIDIDPKELVINESSSVSDSPAVFDKTMLKSSLLSFDERYITNVLPKDTAAMVLNVQKAGIAVTGYHVEKVDNILGGYEMHKLRLNPVIGMQSTLSFKLPSVDKDGTYTSNGVKYRLRKQRGDLPIRKISPSKVALTSYYGKAFVNRSKKKADDYGYWLQCKMMEKILNKEDQDITEVALADVFDNTLASPRVYGALSMTMRSFKCKGVSFLFDHKEKLATYPRATVAEFEKDGSLLVGKTSTGEFMVMDKDSTLYYTSGKTLKPFGTMEMFLGINSQSSPVEFASLGVFGKDVPIGVILGLQLGFEKLVRMLKVEPRRVNAGSRLNLTDGEYALTFSDETLIFSKDDRFASMVLGGFNDYAKTLRLFSVHSFDKRGVYLNLLEANGLGTRYIREIDLMYQMFIDPITKDLLIEMKEPTTFQGLLLRSCELLLNDQHPDELDPAYMRIKGYERLAGAVYTELIQAIRGHNGRISKSNARIEMNPYVVWRRISEDPAKNQVSEINPIEALKEMEAVTFAGTGGRNKRSMTKSTRAYHPNDMGTISESTVDSTDVAVNIFTSADPQFTSLRGMSKRYDINKTGATALISTSALMAPGSDKDDPKRVNFVAIQQSHSIACDGYHQFTVRTGYDQVIAHRSYDLFAHTAKKPGTVQSINRKGIIVAYEDGEVEGYELGRRFGNAAGLVVPHDIVTPLEVGDKIAIGDVVVYNTGFFEPDFFNPKQVVLKNSINVKTVLWESTQTLEDASSISTRAASKLTTNITKVKTIVVAFDQAVSRLVKVGDVVQADSLLCIIEDAVTANNKLFDDQSLDTLRALSAQTPRANLNGTVEKIEVFYHGEKEDMSESLRLIANTGDRELKNAAASVGRRAFTGSVDGGFRVESDQLGLDSMAIRIYITTPVSAGVGDKGVFCNQMKTVFSEVLEHDYLTEEGEKIDAVFSVKSINARIVLSPFIIGTSNTLLSVIAKRAVQAYRGTLPQS